MKHVLITGGSDGLGKVTAQKLRDNEYLVTILGQDELKTKQVAADLGCKVVIADVSDSKAVEAAFKKASEVQPIDILINNAGIWIQGPLEDNKPNRIQKVFEVNALGTIYATRAIVPEMKKRAAGRIINVISQAGLYAKAERSVYDASKWALTGFTKCMQLELKPFNISVVGLYPGAISHTSLFKKAGNDRDMSKALSPEIIAEGILHVCNLPEGVNVPEFGIESLYY